MQGKAVIVTGAARGIGKAIVTRCLAAGAHVAACDRDAEALAALAAELKNAALSTFTLDITQPQAVASAFSDIAAKTPPLCALVNNAGIFFGRKLADYSPDQMQQVLSVNLLGALYCTQAFAGHVLASGRVGTIVSMASVAGQAGSSDAVYGASKAAVIGLTKSCSLNFAPHIRVNAVAPGLVETDMLDAIPTPRLEQYRQAELIKQPITPQVIAGAVYFLLSEESAHMTGTVLDINNGCYQR